jgi:hypothetical protein
MRDISNREMDRAVDLAEAENAYAVEHASDNSVDHVAARFRALHVQTFWPVALRFGTVLDGVGGRLFPQARRAGAMMCRAHESGNGIVAPLTDEATGMTSDFRIEIDGRNGVHVTAKVA